MATAASRHFAHAAVHLHLPWHSESEDGVNADFLIKQVHPNKTTDSNKHVVFNISVVFFSLPE